MARKQADAFNQFYNEAVKPLKTRVTNLENGAIISTDTTTVSVSGGLQLAIGDNQPVNKSAWLDTSKYSSVNGAIATYSPTASGGNLEVEVSNTEPTDTSVAWINTNDYEGD